GSLPNLPANVLALVADALALVRLRLADGADLRSGLPDHLLVRALDDHDRRLGHVERDPRARLDDDGVRIADVELEVGAAHRGAIADALDLQALLEALRDALDHVRDQAARETVQRAVLAPLGRALDRDRPLTVAD